jgi:hypothetical protein
MSPLWGTVQAVRISYATSREIKIWNGIYFDRIDKQFTGTYWQKASHSALSVKLFIAGAIKMSQKRFHVTPQANTDNLCVGCHLTAA